MNVPRLQNLKSPGFTRATVQCFFLYDQTEETCVPFGMLYEAGRLYCASRGELYKQDITINGLSTTYRPLRRGEPVIYMGKNKVLVHDGVFFTYGGIVLTCHA
jgi:hypothetical protein